MITGYKIANLNKLIYEIGEDETKSVLSDFCCPLNEDVELYAKQKAIDFAKQGWAQTHLVFASYKEKPVIVGYFSLANKYIQVPFKSVNGDLKRKLAKHALPNLDLKAYCLAIPLIAQIGKNYKDNYNNLIRGDELLGMACDKIKGIQYDLGGRFAYLECEDRAQLIDFYKRNGFVEFDRREVDPDEYGVKGKELVQMLRMFKGRDYT